MFQLRKPSPLDLDERGVLPRLSLGDRECQSPPEGSTELLVSEGELRLPSGSYEFELQSFCLEAGKHSPGTGSVYALAPLSGPLSGPVARLFRNAAANPWVSQERVQSLLWSIMSRTGYHGWSSDLRQIAEQLLAERDLIILGKNYWRLVPEALRQLALRPVRGLLERLPFWGELERETARWRQLISTAHATYQELEQAFIRPGPPPGEPERRFSAGDWSLVPGGSFVRLFSLSYRKIRMQVYIPHPTPAALERDRLGRVTRLSMNELEVTIDYDDHSGTGGVSLGNGDELPVWRLRRVTLRASVAGRTEEVLLEPPDAEWIARDFRQLAALDPERHPELAGRIETARVLAHDYDQLANLSRNPAGHSAAAPANTNWQTTGPRGAVPDSAQAPPEPPTPFDDIIELKHYENALDAVVKDLLSSPSNQEKVKWLKEHVLRRLRRAYEYWASLLGGLLQGFPGGASYPGDSSADGQADSSGPLDGGGRDHGGRVGLGGLVGLPDDSRKQALGFRV